MALFLLRRVGGRLAQRLDATDPFAMAKGIAIARIAVGVLFLLAPGAFRRAFVGGAVAPATTMAIRMAAARDLALGLGGVLAARRSPASLRGWAEAGALADTFDLVLMGAGTGLKPLARLVGAGSATGAVVAGQHAARRLTAD